MVRKGKFTAVSLFSGCGGMDLGAEQSGAAKVLWAIDSEHWAAETYRRNIGTHIVEGDITTMPVPDVPCDILLAGPPCQDYSTLWNHDGLKTARGNLFREVARFLDVMRPAGFVLENVPGLLSANGGAAWTLVRHALRSPSTFALAGRSADYPPVRYDLSVQTVDFANLGVAQHRVRLIVVGVRRDLRVRPPSIPLPYKGRLLTVSDALDASPIPAGAPNHEVGLDSDTVVERMKLIPPGSNFEHIPEGHKLAVRGLISHVYRRLDPDKPAYTMIAGGGGGTHGYHHLEPRRLSNREKARLQGFPDDFIFEFGDDPKDAKSAYPRVRRQVGNAVPPPAAAVITEALANALDAAGVRRKSSAEISRLMRRFDSGSVRPASGE